MRIGIFASLGSAMHRLLHRAAYTSAQHNSHRAHIAHSNAWPALVLVSALITNSALQASAATGAPPTPEPYGGDVGTGPGTQPTGYVPSTSKTAAVGATTALPTGFSTELVVEGVNLMTAFDFTTDGRIFIASKDGMVRVWQNGSVLPTPFLDLRAEVNEMYDRGLIAMALHPNFPATPYLYLLYPYDPPSLTPDALGARVSRVIRVTADPANTNVALAGSATVILGKNSIAANIGNPTDSTDKTKASCAVGLVTGGEPIEDCIPSDSMSHSADSLVFGKDGTLFISHGDGSHYGGIDPRALRAQDIDSLAGKVLRIDPNTGLGLPDNPFYNGNASSNRSRVYAYGLRQPFRMNIHPVTGEPWVGDVGFDQWEEINTGKGKNFGWPCYEGNDVGSAQQVGYRGTPSTQPFCYDLYNQGLNVVQAPIYAYPHLVNGQQYGAAVGVGAFYSSTIYPAQYRGALFFTDYNRQSIRYLTFGTNSVAAHDFLTDTTGGGPIQMKSGPDGNLYYLWLAGSNSQIRRIRYTAGGNTPPIANASATPQSGSPPLRVSFSSAGSIDPDAQPISTVWSFGNGATSTQANPVYTYTVAGNYTAILTVTDSMGATASDRVNITVGNNAPVVTITAPISGSTYQVGDTIPFSATARDPEGGPVTYAWEGIIHHNQHAHPDFHKSSAPGGSLTIPDHGNNNWIELCLTVSDSAALKTERCVNLLPKTVVHRFVSNPPGLQLVHEGSAYTTPFSITTIVKSEQLFSAPITQAHRTFANWAGTYPAGLNPSEPFQTVIVGSTNAVFTATYTNQTPVARAAASSTNALAPATVVFTGSQSYDPDGDPLSYLWQFGDGASAAQANPIHLYLGTGTFTATLVVTDALGATASVQLPIRISGPTTTPTPTPTATYLPIITTSPTASPTSTSTPTSSPTATQTATPTSTGEPTGSPSATSTSTPTTTPTASPTGPAQSHLALWVTTPITEVQVGDLVSYTAIVSNTGTGTATGVIISATLPDNVEFVAGNSTPGWACVDVICTFTPQSSAAQAAGVMSAEVSGALPAGATLTTTLVVQVGLWITGSPPAMLLMTVQDSTGTTTLPANDEPMPPLQWLDAHPYWLPLLINPGEP